MTKAKKIYLCASIIVIIIGLVMFFVKGFNYSLKYGDATRIIVPMNDDFSVNEFKTLVNEVYGKSEIELTDVFKDKVSIKVKDSNDEKVEKLINKINEKYNYEYTKDDLTITWVSKINAIDLLKPICIPLLASLAIVVAYSIIIYRKASTLKVILNIVVTAVLAILQPIAVYLVCRIPLNSLLIPIVLTTYTLGIIYATKECEKLVK